MSSHNNNYRSVFIANAFCVLLIVVTYSSNLLPGGSPPSWSEMHPEEAENPPSPCTIL